MGLPSPSCTCCTFPSLSVHTEPCCTVPMAPEQAVHPICKHFQPASEFFKNWRKQEMIQAVQEGQAGVTLEDTREFVWQDKGSVSGSPKCSWDHQNPSGITYWGLQRTFKNHFPPAPFVRGHCSCSSVKTQRNH